MGVRDGDGWVACACGRPHWGLYGAAGLLLVRRDLAEPHVLLQLRAPWTHGGGTWALPGGAIDSHEDSVTAALREAHEEAGVDATVVEVTEVYCDDHGNWRYDTVIAQTHGDAGAHAANHESEALQWVLLAEVDDFPLHPGLAASWPSLHARVVAVCDG
ncbi:MAG: NUDIX hydrolase [Ilumatobacteraceae bacterium]|nr:MAG: NUDIX hydrolase [Actinomycetota bacterium]